MRRVTLSLPQRPFLFFCTEHFVTCPTLIRSWGLVSTYHSDILYGWCPFWRWDQTLLEFSCLLPSFLFFFPDGNLRRLNFVSTWSVKSVLEMSLTSAPSADRYFILFPPPRRRQFDKLTRQLVVASRAISNQSQVGLLRGITNPLSALFIARDNC